MYSPFVLYISNIYFLLYTLWLKHTKCDEPCKWAWKNILTNPVSPSQTQEVFSSNEVQVSSSTVLLTMSSSRILLLEAINIQRLPLCGPLSEDVRVTILLLLPFVLRLFTISRICIRQSQITQWVVGHCFWVKSKSFWTIFFRMYYGAIPFIFILYVIWNLILIIWNSCSSLAKILLWCFSIMMVMWMGEMNLDVDGPIWLTRQLFKVFVLWVWGCILETLENFVW